jgi:UDP-glucose 4-epimerase
MIKPHFAIIGAGFIGKAVIRKLLLNNIKVSILDRNSCPLEFVNKTTWFTGSFHDQRMLSEVLAGASVAYHFVSSTVPGDQHVDVAKELNENVVGTLRFVDSCLAAGVKRIVFASSASVYGIQEYLPINESAPTNPISAHGIHKLTIEKFLLLAKHLHGIDVRILRVSNPYGPEQSILGRQGFIGMSIGYLLQGLPIGLRNHGLAIRDFIYIDDLADAFALCGRIDNLPTIINIGTGEGHSLSYVVDLIKQLIHQSVTMIEVESRAVDIPLSILDIGLIRSCTSFIPTTSLRDGLSKTLQHHGFGTINATLMDYLNGSTNGS